MKPIKIICLLLCVSSSAIAQVGIGTTAPATSAVLELQATDKAFLLTRVASVYSVSNPVNGMIVYDLYNNCLRAYEAGTWSTCLSGNALLPQSSSYSCNTAFSGVMEKGTLVTGVTQTITANVVVVGAYSISATANGVTFSATGNYAGLGSQNIVLTATGTPTDGGTFSFQLNTTPSCSFDRYVGYPYVHCNPANPTAVVAVTNPTTGKVWMDRNLGANRAATSATDAQSYGSLFQWT